jgi:hypothetical protein
MGLNHTDILSDWVQLAGLLAPRSRKDSSVVLLLAVAGRLPSSGRPAHLLAGGTIPASANSAQRAGTGAKVCTQSAGLTSDLGDLLMNDMTAADLPLLARCSRHERSDAFGDICRLPDTVGQRAACAVSTPPDPKASAQQSEE